MTPRILVIAGSDSGGGAGIQADIKTISTLGGHAMTAVTSVTAQNTVGVDAVHPIPTEIVLQQIDSVVSDIGADAVKIGMIGSAETAHAVADYLAEAQGVPIVFDPVMVATSGGVLADDATIAAFGALMDRATIVTPNLPELEALAPSDDPVASALKLVSDHSCAVLIKGGHGKEEDIVDALIEEDNMTSWQSTRIDTPHTHGTGCTMASAMTVFLAQGCSLPTAVDRAREFVRLSLLGAPGIGQGSGPMGQGTIQSGWGSGPMMNQVTVGMDDYDASVAFYRKLGLTQIVDNRPDYTRFEAAGGATFSLHRVEQGSGGNGTTVYFECVDLDDMVEKLGRNGLRFDSPPTDQPWLWREARLRDPFGNVICLYKAGENRRYPPWRIGEGSKR